MRPAGGLALQASGWSAEAPQRGVGSGRASQGDLWELVKTHRGWTRMLSLSYAGAENGQPDHITDLSPPPPLNRTQPA